MINKWTWSRRLAENEDLYNEYQWSGGGHSSKGMFMTTSQCDKKLKTHTYFVKASGRGVRDKSTVGSKWMNKKLKLIQVTVD